MSASKGLLPWAQEGIRYPEKIRTNTSDDGRIRRETWRQIGWVGQTGTPYALNDEAGLASEPGGYAPLWLLAHSDELVPDSEGEAT